MAKRSASSAAATDRRGGAAGRTVNAGGPGSAGTAADIETDPALSTDAQLMFESLKASRGESPNAAKIERVSEEVRAESKRKKAAPATTVWKDPFAEDPERPIPVRWSGRAPPRGAAAKEPMALNGPKEKELVGVRRELARARAETAVAQADAAKAQADAARAKANAARAEAAAAQVQASAARVEAVAARAACVVAPDRKKSAAFASSAGSINSSSLVASSTPMRSASSVRSTTRSAHGSRARDGFEEFAQGSRGRNARRGRGSGSSDPFMPAGDQDDAGGSEMTPDEEAGSEQLAESGGGRGRGIVVVPIGQ